MDIAVHSYSHLWYLQTPAELHGSPINPGCLDVAEHPRAPLWTRSCPRPRWVPLELAKDGGSVIFAIGDEQMAR
jgi:hypothetical protein